MHVSDFLANSIISPACFFSSSFLFAMSYDGGFSVFVQDHQKLLPGSVAAVTPLSFCRSCKGTSADSSHLHLGTAESLSLCRSDPLPQKLLAHLAESGGTELCPLSPYMLRLSGAGFAYCAPGPETSVWTQMQTLKLLHLRDPWITQRRHVQTHLKHGHSMLSSPCAFLGYTWVKNPLDSIALTPNSHTCLIFFFFSFFFLVWFSKFPAQTLTWKSLWAKGEPCAKMLLALWSCAVWTVEPFCISSSHFQSDTLAWSSTFASPFFASL